MKKTLDTITRSLKHRNYRLFFFGQLISLTGTWISSVATSWLIYRLTGSAVLLGTLTAAELLPSVLVSPFAGVHLDRWNRRSVLLATQLASMVQALILAALVLSGSITVLQLIVLSIIKGIINGVDLPARQSFVRDIVDSPDALGNAIALNAATFHGARFVGPALGGLIISFVGEGWCFLIDGLSYFTVLGSLQQIQVPCKKSVSGNRSVFTEFAAGIRYVREIRPIGALIAFAGVISFGIGPYFALLPIYARESLSGGASLYGILMAFSGLGSFCGSLYLASRQSVLGLGRLIVNSGAGLAAAFCLLAMSPDSIYASACLFAVGLSVLLIMASTNTILQSLVHPSLQGRVMSLYTSAFAGFAPLGGFIGGNLAELVGVRMTFVISSAIVLTAVLIFKKRLPALREEASSTMIAR